MNATPLSSGLHHLELWTADLAVSEPAWHWLMTTLGWRAERVEGWELGRIWRHGDGSYIVLEQSEDVRGEDHTAWYAEDPHGIEVELVAGP